MIENYKYFMGKPCTVLTQKTDLVLPQAWSHGEYFSGIVTEINQYGIWVRHLKTNTKAFFTFPIVGIVEEPSVSESDPKYNQIKEELEKKKIIPARPVPNITSVEEMTKRAKEIKEARLPNIPATSSKT